jgi:hypothetical protein
VLVGNYFLAVFLNEFPVPDHSNVETAMEMTKHILGID